MVGGYNRHVPWRWLHPACTQSTGCRHASTVRWFWASARAASADIISVLEEARSQGALTASITNATSSPLADVSDFVIDVQAGNERAIAATKSYTSQVTAVALLSAVLAQDAARLAELDRLPAAVQATLAMNDEDRGDCPRYRYMTAAVVIQPRLQLRHCV